MARHVKNDNDGSFCGSLQRVHTTRANGKLFTGDCETLTTNGVCTGTVKEHKELMKMACQHPDGLWLTSFSKIVLPLSDTPFHESKPLTPPVWRASTHSAELAAHDENPALVEHACVQVQHVVHIYSHKILRQVSLGERGRAGVRLSLWVLTSNIHTKAQETENNQSVCSPLPLS